MIRWSIALALALFSVTAGAQLSEPSRTVTLELNKASGVDALTRIFQGANVDYVMGDAVLVPAARVEITGSYENRAFRGLLDELLRTIDSTEKAGLTCRFENGVYVLSAKRAVTNPDRSQPTFRPPDRKRPLITMSLDGVPASKALITLFDKADVDYVIPPLESRTKITLSVTDVPFEAALQSITASLHPPLQCHDKSGRGLFAVSAGSGPALAAGPGTNASSFRIRNADIRYALQALFSIGHTNYTLHQSVSGHISLRLRNVPLETALDVVLSASLSPVTYHVEDGVISIIPAATGPGGM